MPERGETGIFFDGLKHRGMSVVFSSCGNGQFLITRTLLGHYHAELHKAEARPEDIHRPLLLVCTHRAPNLSLLYLLCFASVGRLASRQSTVEVRATVFPRASRRTSDNLIPTKWTRCGVGSEIGGLQPHAPHQVPLRNKQQEVRHRLMCCRRTRACNPCR